VFHTIVYQHPTGGWYVNNKLKSIWKEMVTAYFKRTAAAVQRTGAKFCCKATWPKHLMFV
jgi:hypothetical protein